MNVYQSWPWVGWTHGLGRAGLNRVKKSERFVGWVGLGQILGGSGWVGSRSWWVIMGGMHVVKENIFHNQETQMI